MSRTPFTVVTAANSVRKLSNADTGNTRHTCIHVKRTPRPKLSPRVSKKRTKPFEKLSTPFLEGGEKERERERNSSSSIFITGPTGLNPTTIGEPRSLFQPRPRFQLSSSPYFETLDKTFRGDNAVLHSSEEGGA